MIGSLLRSLAWLLAAFLLYGAVLLLDLYWNVLNWRPRWDGVAAALLFGQRWRLGSFYGSGAADRTH